MQDDNRCLNSLSVLRINTYSRTYSYPYLSRSKISGIKKKILFIGDDTTLLEIAPLLFKGYEVLTASDGTAVPDLTGSLEPDVVIDIVMGMIDGNTRCMQIKNHPRFRLLPVILMTGGLLQQKDRPSAADGYVEKSFDIAATQSLIERITAD